MFIFYASYVSIHSSYHSKRKIYFCCRSFCACDHLSLYSKKKRFSFALDHFAPSPLGIIMLSLFRSFDKLSARNQITIIHSEDQNAFDFGNIFVAYQNDTEISILFFYCDIPGVCEDMSRHNYVTCMFNTWVVERGWKKSLVESKLVGWGKKPEIRVTGYVYLLLPRVEITWAGSQVSR